MIVSEKTKAPKLTREEVIAEVSALFSAANAVTKPPPSEFGMANHLETGVYLILELLKYPDNDVHVTFFVKDHMDRRQKPAWEDTLGLKIEASSPSQKMVGTVECLNNGDWRLAIFEGFSAEEWPELKFRLLPEE